MSTQCLNLFSFGMFSDGQSPTVDFNVFSSPDHRFFKHLIGNKKGNRICPFGHVAIFALVAVLLFGSRPLIRCSLVIAFILSLMNLNALVYLIPVFVYNKSILV